MLWPPGAREHVVPATSGGERDRKPEEEQDGDAPEGRDHVPAFSNGAWHRTREGAEYSIGLSHYIGCVGHYGHGSGEGGSVANTRRHSSLQPHQGKDHLFQGRSSGKR